MIILSYNIDGYDDQTHQYLINLTTNYKIDVLFLSETKCDYNSLSTYLKQYKNYNYIINVHQPTKWHGVAMLILKEIKYQQIPITMGIPVRKDSNSKEAAIGRIIMVKINDYHIIGSYTPNSGQTPEKLQYRVQVWDPAFLKIINGYDRVIWVGDQNVALEEIDVSNPHKMKYYAGFRPEERANFKQCSLIDVWRHENPTLQEYTWKGYNPSPTYGMRLDHIMVSPSLLPLCQSFTLKQSNSDHIPIGIKIKK